jgi:hypothetical protein
MSLKSDKPIRESTWHLIDTKTKIKHVVERVLIAGGNAYLRVIAESPVYLNRVYDQVYTGKTREHAFKERRLEVHRIEIHDKPDLGYGVGCLDEDAMRKYGFKT